MCTKHLAPGIPALTRLLAAVLCLARCLYCVASNEWDKLAPHVRPGPQPKKT
jgi:hypothetical protein